jgi:hypothetical protein
MYQHLKALTTLHDHFANRFIKSQKIIVKQLKGIAKLLKQQLEQAKEDEPQLSAKAKGKHRDAS